MSKKTHRRYAGKCRVPWRVLDRLELHGWTNADFRVHADHRASGVIDAGAAQATHYATSICPGPLRKRCRNRGRGTKLWGQCKWCRGTAEKRHEAFKACRQVRLVVEEVGQW